jgi:hypothetical protein
MLVVLPVRIPHAQQKQPSSGERVVVCMIQIEHADAENLATVLKPFLSPQGSIVAYALTNTLIIRDRASIVNMLAETIKGKPCTPVVPAPQSDGETGLDKLLRTTVISLPAPSAPIAVTKAAVALHILNHHHTEIVCRLCGSGEVFDRCLNRIHERLDGLPAMFL